MTLRAVIYCRISSDPSGLAIGVDRQRRECTALVEARGWTQAATLDPDNDISAYSGKARPAYRQLLDLIRAGAVDVVVAWDPDRLHRSPAELEEFITLVEKHHVRVETVQAGQWDLSTPSGRLVARQLGSVARYESEHKAERVRSALAHNATEGTPHGRRAYGWRRAGTKGARRDVVVAREAAVVRRIAEAIIAGESLRQITADLNADRVPSPTGLQWRKGMVRHVVLRERNAGLRRHRGEIVGDATWTAILDRGQWEQVCAVLTDPTRKTSTGTAAAHLLSGIARCYCGEVIRATMNRTIPSYRCPDGHVSRNRRDVDEYVTGVVVGVLGRLELDRVTPGNGAASAAEEARTLRGRLDRAADDYADGRIDNRQLERITARLRPQVEAAEARARIVDDTPMLAGVLGDQAAARWAELSLSRRRAIVDYLVTVTILRSSPGARVFDTDTVRIDPKEQA